MTRRYLTYAANGVLAISQLDSQPDTLAKTLFELSRTTDLTTHFDPAIHTLDAIADGISGHRALALTAECEDTDLPTDRYFRDAWEWSN